MIANSVHDAFLQTCCVAMHFNAAVSLKKGLGEHKYLLTLSAILTLFPMERAIYFLNLIQVSMHCIFQFSLKEGKITSES